MQERYKMRFKRKVIKQGVRPDGFTFRECQMLFGDQDINFEAQLKRILRPVPTIIDTVELEEDDQDITTVRTKHFYHKKAAKSANKSGNFELEDKHLKLAKKYYEYWQAVKKDRKKDRDENGMRKVMGR